MTENLAMLDDPRIQAAIDEFKVMISARFPGTTYTVSIGDDPEGVYLDAIVDLDDPDEVMDLIIKRLVDVQVDEDLPFYVIPLRTPERRAAMARTKRSPWDPRPLSILDVYDHPSTA